LRVHVFPKVVFRNISRSIIPRNVDITAGAPVPSPGISHNYAVFVVTNNCHHVQAFKRITGLSFIDGAIVPVGLFPDHTPHDTSAILIKQLLQTVLGGFNRMESGDK